MNHAPKFRFANTAPGRYWYLYWIGKIIRDDGFKISLYFINSVRNDNHTSGFKNDYREVHKVAIEILYFFSIGTIYDTKTQRATTSKGNYLGGQIFNVFRKSTYLSVNYPLPFLDSKYTPLNNEIDFEGLRYYRFSGWNRFKKDVWVLLPIQVFCSYFYFSHSKLITLIINHSLSESFILSEKRIIYDKDVKIGYVKYDNSRIDKSEAEALAPFLFMKNDSGIRNIDAISYHLRSYFINNKKDFKKFNSGVYLKAELPFQDDMTFTLQGKEFRDGETTYFMAHKILNHEFKIENPLTINEIRLEELYPGFSKKRRKNESNMGGVKIIPPTNNNLDISLQSPPGSSTVPTLQNNLETTRMFSFGVPINHIKRDPNDKNYNPNTILTDSDLSKGTLNAYNVDATSEHLRVKFKAAFNKVNRFDLIKTTILMLKENYGVNFKFDTLDLRISADNIYTFYEKGILNEVMAVELCYDNKYFYLIEFEKGHAGFIHDVNYEQIIPFKLEMFIVESIIELTELNKNEYIWTVLKRRKNHFKEVHGIILEMSLKHQTKNLKNSFQVAEKMAGKIFNDRILKLVS